MFGKVLILLIEVKIEMPLSLVIMSNYHGLNIHILSGFFPINWLHL